MEFMFMKDFFDKRNQLYGFKQPFQPSHKRYEPLVSHALKEMDQKYQNDTSNNVNKYNVTEGNLDDEFDKILKDKGYMNK